jgi:hypothetical protein
MKSTLKVFVLIMFFVMAGCSTSNIANRGEYIEKASFSKGMPRVDVLARFGRPVETKKKKGRKVDLYRLEQGERPLSKFVKGGLSAFLAVSTIGLSEIVADPVTRTMPVVVFEVYYDKDERVEYVHFIQTPK